MNTKLQKPKQRLQIISADYSESTIYIGIDVHKANWACCIYVDGTCFKTFVHTGGADGLLTYLKSNFPGGNYQACYEAGFCGFSVQRELARVGINCIVVNPADVPQTGKDSLTKTDKVDARRLAEALSRQMLRPIYIPSRICEADRKLVRYRVKIQQELGNHKRAIRSLLFTLDIRIPIHLDNSYWSKKLISWLEELNIEEVGAKSAMTLLIDDLLHTRKKLYEVTKQIKKLSETEQYRALFSLLKSVPGIGLIIGMTLITEIMDITRFSNFKKFNAFVGLYPNQFSSGENVRMGKMTPRHNKFIRPYIIEAAWCSIRHDSALTIKFNEMTKRKTKKRAIVTIARKLLSRIYTVWSNGVLYQKGVK